MKEVTEEPSRYETIVDGYLESSQFGRVMREHFLEWLELDQSPDFYPAGFPAIGPLAGLGTNEIGRDVISAPGRLAEHIIMTDRPWSEILTAEYTFANATVAAVWGVPYDASEGGWQRTTWGDGRPTAGVLTDSWVFTRMPSTENNKNRERASLIANAFVCHDYPSRQVEIPTELDLSSEEAINNAIESNTACVACHHSLDPLASSFAVMEPLYIPGFTTNYPVEMYAPEGAALFESPSWFGRPVDDLRHLGEEIAADPRFVDCAIRRVYSEFMQVHVDDVPLAAVSLHRRRFVEDGMNIRGLVKRIVMSDAFAATSVREGADPVEQNVGFRRATPQQLDSLVHDLTGFRWETSVAFDVDGIGAPGDVQLVRDPAWGYRTLAGGPNNFDTTQHLRTFNPTTLLVLKGIAERAAATAAASREEPFMEPLTDEDIGPRLATTMARVLGITVTEDGPEVDAMRTLYTSLRDQTSRPGRAWEMTLVALFQDPRVLLY